MKAPPWPLQRPSALPRAASLISEPFQVPVGYTNVVGKIDVFS